MTPIIKRLQDQKLFSNWTSESGIKKLEVDFYRQVLPLCPILTLEYSVLCSQIQDSIAQAKGEQTKKQIEQTKEQIAAALMLAELLEHIYDCYLNIPREVARLQAQQKVFKTFLKNIEGFTTTIPAQSLVIGRSPAQEIREYTAYFNWFRLLIVRSKRVLNSLDRIGIGSPIYSAFVAGIDNYANFLFTHLFTWCFFIPRLLANLVLMIKHTIPHPWMSKEEQSLGGLVRFLAQIQRRWFDLANDVLWVGVGLLNCFIFIGALAPVCAYASLFAFTVDLVCVSYRAYIELTRLHALQEEYTTALQQNKDPESQQAIQNYQKYLENRVHFEHLRLCLSVVSTAAIFFSMCLTFASNPVVPLMGAFLLIVIWIAAFSLTRKLERSRPNDVIDTTILLKVGFFSPPPTSATSPVPATTLSAEPNPLPVCS